MFLMRKLWQSIGINEDQIIYGIDGDFIVIIAIAHLRRKPNYWIDRLQNPATDYTDNKIRI